MSESSSRVDASGTGLLSTRFRLSFLTTQNNNTTKTRHKQCQTTTHKESTNTPLDVEESNLEALETNMAVLEDLEITSTATDLEMTVMQSATSWRMRSRRLDRNSKAKQ